MKKHAFIFFTIILNITFFATGGAAQEGDSYFERQIRENKPSSNSRRKPEPVDTLAPANDNFAAAENIVLNENGVFTATRNNSGASKEVNEPNHAENMGGSSVWFTFTPVSTQTVRIKTTHVDTVFDTTLAVYKGSGPGSLTRVGYNDDCMAAGCETTSLVDLKLEAGTVYRIAVDGYNSGDGADAGNFVLSLAELLTPVTYNNIGTAYNLGTRSAGSIAGTNFQASGQVDEPAAYGSFGGKSVWYRFKVPAAPPAIRAMTVEMSMGFSGEFAVYRASQENPTFAQLQKQDNNAYHFAFNYQKYKATFTAYHDTWYFIQVDYNDATALSDTGNFQIKFYQTKLRYSTLTYDHAAVTGLMLFRPSDEIWYDLKSSYSSPDEYTKFGFSTDTLVPADFDGDGLANFAVTRNQNGLKYWYTAYQNFPGYKFIQWGLATDKPVTGDFDRDGIADQTVVRKENGQLVWYVNQSSTYQLRAFVYGLATDRPVIGDFDGDGATDVAVVRNEGGNFVWYILQSGGSGLPYAQSASKQFGLAADTPVAEDYDGDGKTDIAVYRPAEGAWYILRSATGELQTTPFGVGTDTPVPADYDGDGKADLAVFRPSEGKWYFWFSYTNTQKIVSWGKTGDVPVSSMTRFSMP